MAAARLIPLKDPSVCPSLPALPVQAERGAGTLGADGGATDKRGLRYTFSCVLCCGGSRA